MKLIFDTSHIKACKKDNFLNVSCYQSRVTDIFVLAVIEQFLSDVCWGDLDYFPLICDIIHSDGAILVTNSPGMYRAVFDWVS